MSCTPTPHPTSSTTDAVPQMMPNIVSSAQRRCVRIVSRACRIVASSMVMKEIHHQDTKGTKRTFLILGVPGVLVVNCLDQAVSQADDARNPRRDARIMRNHHDRLTFTLQIFDERHD